MTKSKTNKSPSYIIQPGNNLAYLLLTFVLVVLSASLYESILSWILILVVCGAVMRIALFLKLQKHLPTMRTLNLLAVLSGLGLVYSGWQLGLLLGMVNLLVMACALKLMQLRSRRDYYQLVTSLLFLIGCGFIFQQNISYTIMYILLMFSALLSLGFFHSPNSEFKAQMYRVSLLCGQALPISLLLFLLLPQLPPLWQTPISKSSQTGLSEKITPGDIANLSQSTELAFRATFTGNIPSPRERYWRTIVMEDFDGKSWQVHPNRKIARRNNYVLSEEFNPTPRGEYYEYEVIAEATQQRWLFALDLAIPDGIKSNNEIWQGHDYQLISQRPLVSQYQYNIKSYKAALDHTSSHDLNMQLNLHTPRHSNDRTQAWVANLRQQHPQNENFIATLLDYFVQQNFRYTLRPDVMLRDPVDQFLFDKQAGFCSHYASALAYALRLGGIPARLVTGYQGGEVNYSEPRNGYLSIYQYDAHAWVEYWRNDDGWQRLDPTALVAPDRIDYGLRQAMLEEGSFLADSPFTLARLANVAWLNNLRLLLADMDYNWSRWVLGFNQQSQQNLFKSILGKLSPQRLAILGLTIVAIIAFLIALFFLPHWLSTRRDATQRYYNQSLQLLEKAGSSRQNWQGPGEFCQQINEQHDKKINVPFAHLTRLYLLLKYQPQIADNKANKLTVQRHKEMRKQLRRLKTAITAI
ncbi:MAG: transglutaminase-like putative cysteine protease [Paraglaciecola sp.]|jgi:transglutaminase-like putative cysteine protease